MEVDAQFHVQYQHLPADVNKYDKKFWATDSNQDDIRSGNLPGTGQRWYSLRQRHLWLSLPKIKSNKLDSSHSYPKMGIMSEKMQDGKGSSQRQAPPLKQL